MAPNPAQAASKRPIRRARDRAAVEAPRTLRPEAGRARERPRAPVGGCGGGRALQQRPGPRAAWTARGPCVHFPGRRAAPSGPSAPGDGAARGQPGRAGVRSVTGTSRGAVHRRCPGAGRAPLAAASASRLCNSIRAAATARVQGDIGSSAPKGDDFTAVV